MARILTLLPATKNMIGECAPLFVLPSNKCRLVRAQVFVCSACDCLVYRAQCEVSSGLVAVLITADSSKENYLSAIQPVIPKLVKVNIYSLAEAWRHP